MKEIILTVNAKRVAAVATNALGRQMSNDVAEAFLLVHGEELEERLGQTLRGFVTGKLKGE